MADLLPTTPEEVASRKDTTNIKQVQEQDNTAEHGNLPLAEFRCGLPGTLHAGVHNLHSAVLYFYHSFPFRIPKHDFLENQK